MIELTMICEYLDDAYPEPPLRPSDPYLRGRMRLWTKKLDDWMHADTGTLSSCIAFRYQYLARLDTPEKLEQHLNSMPSADKRTRQRANITQGIESPYFVEASGASTASFARSRRRSRKARGSRARLIRSPTSDTRRTFFGFNISA